jgi:hypothetical protein
MIFLCMSPPSSIPDAASDLQNIHENCVAVVNSLLYSLNDLLLFQGQLQVA